MMQLGEVETDFAKEINEAFKFFDKDQDGEVRSDLNSSLYPQTDQCARLGSSACAP